MGTSVANPVSALVVPGRVDGEDNDKSEIRTDLHEERYTATAGIATFATAVIPSGTRLFSEKALVVMPENATHLELHRAVTALPAESQAEYWRLAADSKSSKDVSWIDRLRTSHDEDSPDDFNAIVESHEKAWSIYETNRFSMRSPNGEYKLGIFPKSARINHSCAPNVFHRYNTLINRLTIHALRTIQPGEELNTSYIDICHPTAARRILLKGWGFRCRCAACDSPDDEADYRRKKLADLRAKITKREKKREVWTEQDANKALAVMERAMRLMEKEGMEETDTLGMACVSAARLALEIDGREEDALAWAQRAVDVEVKCLGADSGEYQAAVELRNKCEKAVLGRSQIRIECLQLD